MTNRYKSLEDFRTAKIQVRQERDHHARNISNRWALLREPQTRGALLRDAVGDVLRSWKPYRRVHDVLNGHISGSTVAAVGMAVASMQRGIGKRLLYSGISMLLGKAIGNNDDRGSGLLSTLASAVGGVVRRMRERKAEREEEEELQPRSSS
ncbi:MAG: hypothetical protein ABI432_17875 [Flavobacteriales bacterium]